MSVHYPRNNGAHNLTTNADLMASRQWKYYIETNEWTRATCALMACLFTRDQMANSTVLGRGGSQRARLPSNLVSYVVIKLVNLHIHLDPVIST
ncbi:BEN domain [Schistosoma japonicum]|uniref:BEN domain n=1 Tax=Schistosoma japonicum TaxID=6182 RepID=A0A4Z2CKN5_SCHJA|nr:BEN domain [Schistosoma japonicum]